MRRGATGGMRLHAQVTSTNGLFPKALYALYAARNVVTFESLYGLRPPLGVYNVSLSAVLARFEKVVAELDSFERAFTPDGRLDNTSASLLEAMDHLLDSLFEHTEDCDKIIKSFFPKMDKLANGVLDGFRESIFPYRDHVARIANHIKHDQGRLRAIVFSGGNFCYPGYFVEGVVKEGVVGPTPKVHRTSNTAFSFNRDLRFHIAGLYFCGTHLAHTVNEVARVRPLKFDEPKESKERLERVLEKVAKLQQVVFPDEINLTPVQVKQRGTGFEIAMGGAVRGAKRMPSARIQILHYGDGVTKSFKAPYLGAG